MHEQDWMLPEDLPAIPPEDIVSETSPWLHAMRRIIVGLALTSITLNFLLLQYILPTVGTVLLLLGFRSLRRENRAFGFCYVIAWVRGVFLFGSLMWNATIYSSQFTADGWIFAAAAGLQLAQLIGFAVGIETVKRKVDVPNLSNSAKWLPVWYIVLCVLTLMGSELSLVAVILLAAYIGMLVSLSHLAELVHTAGYSVRAAAVRISDSALAWILAGVLALGLLVGYLFFGHYPMEWTREPEPQRSEIRAELLALGFPEAVLEDLSESDVDACNGALRVVTSTEAHPMAEGTEVELLRITNVAVELPGTPTRWRVIHHFEWTAPPKYFGTECLQLWPLSEGWAVDGEVTGRLLCELDDTRCTAPYYALGSEIYTAQTMFWGGEMQSAVFAEFSPPHKGSHLRGYLSFTAQASTEGAFLESWVFYTHQNHPLQYPVLTAKAGRINSADWLGRGVFSTIQSVIQPEPN